MTEGTSRNQQREADFFDKKYEDNPRAAIGQVYSIIRGRDRFFEDTISDDIAGKRALEYGCGDGSYAFMLAEKGASVVGIDISPVGIQVAERIADERGLKNTEFLVMDAMDMDFPDESFDLVCGSGILHHLDMDISMRELRRVMKPGGRAVFMEPLGHNPAINVFRRSSPEMRTPDEHPLVRSDFNLIDGYFERVGLRFFHLTSFAALALLKTPVFFQTVNFFDKLDSALFKIIPPLGMWAWYAVITMEGPRPLVATDEGAVPVAG